MRRAAATSVRSRVRIGGFTSAHAQHGGPAWVSLCAAQRAQSAGQSPPGLNRFSQSVRAHLAKHSAAPPSTSAPTTATATTDADSIEDDAWVVDRLLLLLLNNPHDDTLHPLLCVRVLQRLGYAVWSDSAGAAAAATCKGWLVRHTYPALASRGPSALSGSLERVTDAVLGPLLPLLGDGTPAATPHSQVQPVVPVVVEWLVSLPTSDRVPLQRWLPWVVAVYAAQGTAAGQQDAGELRRAVALPPLEKVLPPLIHKLRGWVSAEAAPCAPPRASSAALCEDCLAALLAQCGGAPVLAEVLWWSSETPLLCLAGVRRALQRAQACTAAAARPHVPSPPAAPPLPCVTVVLRDDDVFRRFVLRLAALPHGSSASVAPASCAACAPALIAMELHEALDGRGASDVTGGDDADPDMILRFIQPLHEYVQLLQETSAARPGAGPAAPVQLSFSGVLRVLQAVFSRLDALKQQSCCGAAAAGPQRASAQTPSPADPSGHASAYTLLSQKARLHALKSLCETLLRHTRAVQAKRTADAHAAVTEVAVGAWFIDVDVRQQEAVLRRLCGAARALVRVVMEERRRSLVEEGPEGSVLTASSVTAARQQQQQRDARGGAATASASAAPTTVATMASSFDHTLRSLAFRVVEPALWRLGEVCRAARVGVPVHVVPFVVWSAYLRVTAAKSSAQYPQGTRWSAHTTAAQVEETYVPVMQAVAALWTCVGGEAGLRTAQQVLPHPGQHSISTLVEGIRLAALRCFWFDGLHRDGASLRTSSGAAVPSPHAPSTAEGMAYAEWVLQHAPNAFYSVWQRTAPAHTAASIGGTGASAVEETVAAQRVLRARLGLLSILLHVYALNARTLMRRDCDGASSTSAPAADVTRVPSVGSHEAVSVCLGAVPSSIHSLFDCVVQGQAMELGPDGVAAPGLLSSLPDAWSLVLPSSVWEGEEVAACLVMPAAPPFGCTALWELVEELHDLAASSVPASQEITSSAGRPEDDAEGRSEAGQPQDWAWLGSPESLWEAMEQHRLADADVPLDAARPSPPPYADTNRRRPLFLLPWTTLAASHEPWRVYDESGQSRRAALAWAAALRVWLGGASAQKSPDGAVASPHRRRPLVRLVTVAEELRFFAALQRHGRVELHPSVRVCRAEVTREALDVAPAVCSALAAAKRGPADAKSDGWYVDEEDYDGLD